LDFALWKTSKEGEPSWDSPWGKGRPGWHIECSVMSRKFLKTDTLDIHAGGRDLIFPHHENEIAQAEALTGKRFAKYWIHHGLLTINGQKMSKSLGNFVTIRGFMDTYGDADILKLFFLSAHYSHPIDYTTENIKEAERNKERFKILFHNADLIKKRYMTKERKLADFINQKKQKFLDAMDDDFNTARALGVLHELRSETNEFIDIHKDTKGYAEIVNEAVSTIKELGQDVLGIFLDTADSPLLDSEKKLINEREVARANKDFRRSDELREELRKLGIIVEDTKDGQEWRRSLKANS
jgi:cysteinyl-tRNA synthetase